jgi:hypothetical protein
LYTPVALRCCCVSNVVPDAGRLPKAARRHWHVENRMHWVLGVALQKDQSRIRAGHTAQNMAVVRRLALSLLQQEKSLSVGTKTSACGQAAITTTGAESSSMFDVAVRATGAQENQTSPPVSRGESTPICASSNLRRDAGYWLRRDAGYWLRRDAGYSP